MEMFNSGILTNPNDSESGMDEDSDRMDEEDDSAICGSNATSGCESDMDKGLQGLNLGPKARVAALVHSSPSLAIGSPSSSKRAKASGHSLVKGVSPMSSQSSFDSPMLSTKRRATADGTIGHEMQAKKDKSSSSTTSSMSGRRPLFELVRAAD